jgi:hypothetical protein
MKALNQGGKTYRLPSLLNPFQEQLYVHVIDWKRKYITWASGTAHGMTYDAILPDNIAAQRPVVYQGIRRALEAHLQRFPFRIHKYFNHMASSQAANINLFLPILRHPHAAVILGELKPDFARLTTEQLDHGYRIEFWDEPYGCLGDKTSMSGTDADLAIAYYNHDGVLCLWLIEHKLTEAEFTTCGGYRSKGRQPRHDCEKSFSALVKNPAPCYYHDVRKFNYWKITAANQKFFSNHAKHSSCPFRGGINQLWRNQLLALAIEQDKRQPFQQATFSVVRHPRNDGLDKTLADYHALTGGNPKFTTFTSADVIAAASAHSDNTLQAWIYWYRELYDA